MDYKVSIAGNSNLISFHTSQAAASSGLHLLASRIISLPSRARSRPSLRACTHASRATRLATAPGAFPQGCPKVPPVVRNHLQRSRSKQAYAKHEYPLKPRAEHLVERPNLE